MLVVVEFDGALEQAEKDILHDILRIGGVAQVREREPIDAARQGVERMLHELFRTQLVGH